MAAHIILFKFCAASKARMVCKRAVVVSRTGARPGAGPGGAAHRICNSQTQVWPAGPQGHSRIGTEGRCIAALRVIKRVPGNLLELGVHVA